MSPAAGMESNKIHPTAILHPTAQVGENVEIGPYAVIGEDVVLQPRVKVGPHAVVEFAEVGEGSQIHAGAFVGTAPQDLKYRGERTRLVLGPGCVVRECATLNRGTAATGVTKIGARCLFMAYSHVAHDCVIGNEVIVVNSVMLAGHVEVGDGAVLGGGSGFHQFVRIGKLAMIGGGAMVPNDVPPFMLAWGDRARLNGLNLVGLKRRGYSLESIGSLKRAYRDLFTSGAPFKEQLAALQSSATDPAVKELLSFLTGSNRGICRPAPKGKSEDE
jgi:UDP-N-acetylglucosamine acyltransferase